MKVDENGNPLEDYVLTEDEIPGNYVRVDGTNIYAVYNECGVLVGYRERVQNEDGTYSWVDVDPPAEEPENTVEEGGGALLGVTDQPARKKVYTKEKIYTDTKHEDDWTVIYKAVVHRTYDASGNLVSTKTDGPNEINRFPETEISGDLLSGLKEYK